MEEPDQNIQTVSSAILFSGALGVFGLAVALTELGAEWTTGLNTIGITALIVFSAVSLISILIFKTGKLRAIAMLIALMTVIPLGAWSQEPVRRQLFDAFADILPTVALQNAVTNDFIKMPGICEKVSSLNGGADKLLQISKNAPAIAKACASEIAKTPAGKLSLLAETENDASFCDLISRLDGLDSLLTRLLVRARNSVVAQKCLSAEIDRQYETEDALIAALDAQKTHDLIFLISQARGSRTSALLSSDQVGEWLFHQGCLKQDPSILANVGIIDTCMTATVESGWPNICERVGAEVKMATVCSLTRKFTVGMSINEGKRIVHRAIRRFRAQIEADSIARNDSASYSVVSGLGSRMGGGGGGGGGFDRRRLESSGMLGVANGRVQLGSRNAALMPAGMNQLFASVEGESEIPTKSPEEWQNMQNDVFRQMLSGKFDDSVVAGVLDSNGMTEKLPLDQTIKQLFAANGESISDAEAKRLQKSFDKFKKSQEETGENKKAKNAPKKPKERVKKKRDRAIKAQPTLGN